MLINYNYFNFFVFVFVILLITFLLCLLTWLLMNKHYTAEKLSSYECGFEPFNDARKQFSINFYSYGLSFLLFDVEVLLVLPALLSFSSMIGIGRFYFYIFLFLLILGLVYELKNRFLKVYK